MKLVSVYEILGAPWILYRLLGEREQWQSISHKSMPTEAEHMAFFISKPYAAWHLVESSERFVGSVYLTKQREIGVSIFSCDRGNGHGKQAIQLMMELHPGQFLANINPQNYTSKKLFEGLGFRKIQETYAI